MEKTKNMVVWHRGEEVKTEGQVTELHGGKFFNGIITDHPENTASKIGTSVLLPCYQFPQVSEAFGLAIEADPHTRGKMG